MMRSLCQLSTLIFFVCLFSVSAPAADAPRLGPLLEKAMQSPGKSFRLESGNTAAVDDEARQAINRNLVKLPLRFEQNEGQTDEQVKFLSRGQGYQFFLTSTESVMVLTKTEREYPRERFGIRRVKFEEPETVEHAVVRMQVVGGNPEPVIRGEDRLSGTSNYFVGNDKSRWRQGVENFASVHYEGVYPGIDLVYYGNQRKLEYDFIVKPGADPKKIELNFSGADGISIDGQGNLVLKTQVGDVVQHAPVIYQTIDGQKQHIDGRYVLTAPNRITFHVADYDKAHPLIIDPVLEYSTVIGSLGGEYAMDTVADENNNIYVTGHTNYWDFPTVNPLPGIPSVGGIFVLKIHDDNGVPSINFSILLGDEGDYDTGYGIAIDDNGNIFVTGTTSCTSFPLLNELEGDSPGAEVFVVKIHEINEIPFLVYSTCVGGNEIDEGVDIKVNSAGEVYVLGVTTSPDFVLLNSMEPVSGEGDIFILKLVESGGVPSRAYSTLIGGSNLDIGFAMALDASNNVYVAGRTHSSDFDLLNEIKGPSGNGIADMIVFKVKETNNVPSLVFSTYIGGMDYDDARAISLDEFGNVYVTGFSYGEFNTVNPIQGDTPNQFDGVFFKLEENNGVPFLAFSTYVGGNKGGLGYGVCLGSSGNIYLTGNTLGGLEMVNSLMSYPGIESIYLMKLKEINGEFKVLFSSYLGGSWIDYPFGGCTADSSGNAYVAGTTYSMDFPLKNPIKANPDGNEIFITKFSDPPLPISINDMDDSTQSDLLMVDGDGNIIGGLLENSVPQSFGYLLTANPAAGWTVNATGDTNGDNKADLLLYNTTTGEYRIATLDGASVLNDSVVFSIDPVIGLEPRGTGDFDGNGEDEILIYQPSTGIVALAYLAGGAFSSFEIVTTLDTANDWALVDAADFTGDAKTDLLIQNTVTGETAVIEMDGSTAVNTTPVFTLDPVMGLSIVTTADFNGDGKTDILAMHTSGALAVLEMDGTTFQSLYVPGGLLPNWQLVNAGNYDGINKADFLFHDPTTGELITGIQDGATITTYNTVLNFGPASGWTFPH
ncbi:MAG: SBBP repeat-containing protein [Nitrospina sp.]|nr:SBBP repeat-containing protein [Nitrospina sp.]